MAVVNFVMSYYAWFLAGTIIVLLAIIGAYADKTNFGQGKKVEKKSSKEEVDLTNVKLSDAVGSVNKENNADQTNAANKKVVKDIAVSNKVENIDDNTNNVANGTSNVGTEENVNNNIAPSVVNAEKSNLPKTEEITSKSLNLDEKLSKLNNAINDILPEKELIDTSLLDDVSDMDVGLNDKKLFNDKDEFNLDDLKLPKIKKPKKQPKDVWKK